MQVIDGDGSLLEDIRAVGDVDHVHITARQRGDRGIRAQRPTIGDEEPRGADRGLIVDGARAAILIAGTADGSEGAGEGGHRGKFERHAPAAAAIRNIRPHGRTAIGDNRSAAGQRADREIEATTAGPGTVTIRGRIIGAVGDDLPVHGQRAVDDQPHRAAAGSAGMPTYIVISCTAAEIGGGKGVVIGCSTARRGIGCGRLPIAAVAAVRAGAAETAVAAAGARPGRAGIAGAGDVEFTAGGERGVALHGQRQAAIQGRDMTVIVSGQIAQHGEDGAAAGPILQPVAGVHHVQVIDRVGRLLQDARVGGDIHVIERRSGDGGIGAQRAAIGNE